MLTYDILISEIKPA